MEEISYGWPLFMFNLMFNVILQVYYHHALYIYFILSYVFARLIIFLPFLCGWPHRSFCICFLPRRRPIQLVMTQAFLVHVKKLACSCCKKSSCVRNKAVIRLIRSEEEGCRFSYLTQKKTKQSERKTNRKATEFQLKMADNGYGNVFFFIF